MNQRNKIKQEIMSFYKKRPGFCFGAFKVDKALKYDHGGTATGEHLSWNTHAILKELEEEGFLKHCYNKGFCLKD